MGSSSQNLWMIRLLEDIHNAAKSDNLMASADAIGAAIATLQAELDEAEVVEDVPMGNVRLN